MHLLFYFTAYGRLQRNTVTKFRLFRSSVKAFLLYGCETWKVTKRPTRDLQTFVNRRLRKYVWSSGLTLSPMRNCGGVHERKSVSANKPAEMDASRTYTDEEPLCLKQSLSWNHQRRPSRSRRRMIEQKDLERGKTNSLRVRWLCFVEVPCSELEYKELT